MPAIPTNPKPVAFRFIGVLYLESSESGGWIWQVFLVLEALDTFWIYRIVGNRPTLAALGWGTRL